MNGGAVYGGDFGPSFRRTYSIKGDAINLAARVMGKNEGAIKTLQYRAVRTLARLLPDDAR